MTEPTARGPDPDLPTERPADSLRFIEEALRGLRFGTVTVTVQDGVLVQVERTEKRRLPAGVRPPRRNP
jgi:hypothetical protein